jgi:protease IV
MAITSDIFIERALLKKKLNAWRIFAVIAILLMGLSFVNKASRIIKANGDYIARITISDVVEDNKKLYELFEQVHNDKNARALIIELDTPGGVAVAGEEIFRRIENLKQDKPVVATMRSICASAGYMIAMSADYVVAMRGTITGSIGVLLQSAEFSKLAEKIGVTPITIRSGELKGNPSMGEPISEKSTKVLQEMIDDLHVEFVNMVAKSRNIPVEKVRKIADGRVYSASDALKLDLIDAIGDETEALNWLEKNKKISADLPVLDVKIKQNFEEKFARITGLSGWLGLSSNRNGGLMLIWDSNF